MSGTIPLSMTQQFDVYGKPLAGGQLYLMQAGTVSTPQNGFQDTALTIPLPNPIPLDAAGRVPQFFLADGTIKIRLQDKAGVVQLAADQVLVIGPSAGSGSGAAAVDGTTLYQTGDIKPRYGTGIHPVPAGGVSPGWVRCNGRTIGSATASPSATERGSEDCRALFVHLYNNDATLVVSGGRSGNATNDFNNNKTIATPDFRGYALSGLDGMGSSVAGRLTIPYAGLGNGAFNADSLGVVAGFEQYTLVSANIPSAGLGISGTAASAGSHSHTYTDASVFGAQKPNGAGTTPFAGTQTGTTSTDGAHTHPVSGSVTGGGDTGFRTIGPRKLVTFYIKL